MKKALNSGITIALLLTGTISILYLTTATFRCSVSALFPLWVVLICLTLWLIGNLPKGIWIGIPLIGVLVFALVRYRAAEIKSQFLDLSDKITEVFTENILHRPQSYSVSTGVQDHTLMFLMLAFLFAAWFLLALTSHGARLHMILIGSLPLFAFCIFLNEDPPVPAVLGMLLFWLLTAAGGDNYRESSNGFAAVLYTALPLLLLLLTLLSFVDPEHYSYQEPLLDVMGVLDRAEQKAGDLAGKLLSYDRFSVPESVSVPQPAAESGEGAVPSTKSDPGPVFWRNENGMLDLMQDLNEEDLNRIFLQVKGENSGSVYLRNYSFGDYTGIGWLPADESGNGSSLAFTAQAAKAAGGEKQDFQIRSLTDAQFRFLPYYCEESTGSDCFVISGHPERYTVSCVSLPVVIDYPVPGEGREEEKQYREYAYDYYTRLPEETRRALLSICEEAGLYPGSDHLIEKTAEFVRTSGVYDLHAQQKPGSDIAVSFLSEEGRGTCIHFASAAAVLYRSLGIPARLTVGFLADIHAGDLSAVRGSDAHAWVEVYRDGIGWIPVEVTGQSGLSDGASFPKEEERAETTDTDNYQERPEEAYSGENAPADLPGTPTPEKPDSDRSARDSVPVGMIMQPVTESETATDPVHSGRGEIFLIFVILLPVVFLPARRLILNAVRRRRIRQSDTRKAVIAVYHLARRAAVRSGEEIPAEIRTCAEKAVFSLHEISDDEAEQCRAKLHEMVLHIREKLNPLKWFLFRLFF